MNDEMKRTVDCERFRGMIDAYLDGALSNEEMDFMQAHAEKCEACKCEIRLSQEILSSLQGMDDDIAVPLSAQNAWRRAVRKEIARKKHRGIVRAFASAAAAVAVLVASTIALRQTDMLSIPAANDSANTYQAAEARAVIRIPPEHANENIALTMNTSMAKRTIESDIVLLSDGGDAQTDEAPAAGFFGEPLSENESAAESKYFRSAERIAETELFEEEVQTLSELVEEYDGYIAEQRIDSSGHTRIAHFTVSLPDEQLDGFLLALENIGKTVSVTRKTEDVGEYYYDAEARLITQKQIVERLTALIYEADGETLADLNRQLEEAYSRIDEMERVLRNGGEELPAQVMITLSEKSAQPVPTKEPSLSERSASGFRQSLSAIGDFFKDMVVSMAIIAPAVIGVVLLSAIVVVVILLVKRSGKKGGKESPGKDEE